MRDRYSEALDVVARHSAEIMAIPGIHGIGVGSGKDYGGGDEPCLVIYVDFSADLQSVPRRIEGFQVFTARTTGFEAQAGNAVE